MSGPVDVRRNLRMALQHVLICGPDETVQRAIQEAHDAVTEMIEAATPFAKLECLGASIESSPDDAVAIITIGTIKRVRAALARVQGGAA